jgi:hypothetical protein
LQELWGIEEPRIGQAFRGKAVGCTH